jgi:plastocyanin
MTWRWRTFFSSFRHAAAALGLVAGLSAATVTGRVELTGTPVKDLSGVVIWLEPASPEPIRPGRATMTQRNKTFTPHVLAISAGTTVDFPNLDPIFHNAFSSFDGKVFDVGLYPPGSSRAVRFDRPGIVRLFCNIHPAMSAVIVVVNGPWFAVSAHDGTFEISGVPPGGFTLYAYHERATPQTLFGLSHAVTVRQDHMELPVISISETGYLPSPHKNKYGKDYPRHGNYSERMP